MSGFGLFLKVFAVLAFTAVGFGAAWKIQGMRLDRTQSLWDLERAQNARALATEQARTAQVSERVVVKYLKRAAEVREVTKEVIREVPVFVSPESDAACVIPLGFLRVRDAAASCTGALPEPSPGTDGAPSTVTLSQLAAADAAWAGQYCEVSTRLEGLQEWVRNITRSGVDQR